VVNIAFEARIRRELLESQDKIMSRWASESRSIVEEFSMLRLHPHQAARYIEALGLENAKLMLKAFASQSVARSIRVNTRLASVSTVVRRLEDKGFKLDKHPYIGYGLIVRFEPMSIGATHEYLLGLYTIQGPASMLAVPALNPPPKGRVLDMCAGAGVKTTQISQHSPEASIIAVDINRRKLLALKNNASRLAATNILALRMDAREAWKLGVFDSILLDAPCSGEGILHLEKGRWPRSIDDIVSRVILQYQLLKAGLKALREGGALLYSTCSVTVEENEYVISLILEEHDDIKVDEPPIRGGDRGITDYSTLRIASETARCKRFFPHRHGTEGFTICRIRKAR
jgi:NOL1/NOP2/sun family putative RNA methylase